MKFVFMLCLFVGLQSVYSQGGIQLPTIIQIPTITYHTMLLPPQSFQQAVYPQYPGQIYVRDRSSPHIPMIYFNEGDIQHIIEEMHFTPRQQENSVEEDDFDMMIKLFSISPDDEDLGQAMKKNRHVETRLPVYFRPSNLEIKTNFIDPLLPLYQISAQEEPKVIPQSPAQRTAILQSSPQARSFNIIPSKSMKQQREPAQDQFFNFLSFPKLSEQELQPQARSSNVPALVRKPSLQGLQRLALPVNTESTRKTSQQQLSPKHESESKSRGEVSPQQDQVVGVKIDGKDLNSGEVQELMQSGVFDGLLASLTKEPFSSMDQKKPVVKNDRETVQSPKSRQLKSPASRSSSPVATSSSRRVLPDSSNELPSVAQNSTPASNVLHLDDIPSELLEFMDFLNGNGELPQSLFSSNFFEF